AAMLVTEDPKATLPKWHGMSFGCAAAAEGEAESDPHCGKVQVFAVRFEGERNPMSYDIAIFDPAHAPREREAFLQWWDKQEWAEWDRYNDPAVTTPSLRAWFREMIEDFPALNGPYASPTDHRAASYSLGHFLIYVAIWFNPRGTHERAFNLAAKYRLGFFEPSSPSGEIWVPGAGDQLV